MAVVLTALLQAIPASAPLAADPISRALHWNMMFQWAFSVPVLAFLAYRRRLGWLAAAYGVAVIGVAHQAALSLAVHFLPTPLGHSGVMSRASGYVAAFTGAAISFLAFQAYGRSFRTQRALVLMAGGVVTLTALGGLLDIGPIQILYMPWQFVFGAVILELSRSRRASGLW